MVFSKVSSGTVIVPGKRSRDLSGEQFDPQVVLADRHVRPVLLGAADRDDRNRLARGELIAQFGPGQLFDVHARSAVAAGRAPAGDHETK